MNWSNLLPYLHLTEVSEFLVDCMALHPKIQFFLHRHCCVTYLTSVEHVRTLYGQNKDRKHLKA